MYDPFSSILGLDIVGAVEAQRSHVSLRGECTSREISIPPNNFYFCDRKTNIIRAKTPTLTWCPIFFEEAHKICEMIESF